MIIEAKSTQKGTEPVEPRKKFDFNKPEKASRVPLYFALLITGIAAYLKSAFPALSQDGNEPRGGAGGGSSNAPQGSRAAAPLQNGEEVDEITTGSVEDGPRPNTVTSTGTPWNTHFDLPDAPSLAYATLLEPFSLQLTPFFPAAFAISPSNDNAPPQLPAMAFGAGAGHAPADFRDQVEHAPGDFRDHVDHAPDDFRDKVDHAPDDFRDKVDHAPPVDHGDNDNGEDDEDEDDDDDDDDDAENTPVNRAPITSGAVRLHDVFAGQVILIGLSQLLFGASDPDGDALSVNDITVTGGTLAQVGDGWSLTTLPGMLGVITITYDISDGLLEIIQTAMLEIVRRVHRLTADDDVYVGTIYDDDFDGLGGNDIIDARAGNDVVVGADGDDHINGGDGDDQLFGGRGNDVIFGGAGNDLIGGGAGNDRLFGEEGNDIVDGDEGDDTLMGGAGDDLLDGGTGDDLVLGDAGDDAIAGGDGEDILAGGDGEDVIDGGADADDIEGNAGADIVMAGAGDDDVSGGEDDDNLSGEAGDDLLLGDAGDDILDGGDGGDTLSGGTGDDVIDGGADDDDIEGNAGADIVMAGDGDDDVSGGEDDDNLSGEAGNDALLGDAGDDVMDGGTGDDELAGGAGDDQLFGDVGDDLIEGDDGIDMILAGDGDDMIDAGAGDDIVQGDAGDDTIDGGDGHDVLDYSGFTADIYIDLGGGTATSAEIGRDIIDHFEEVMGGTGADTIVVGSTATIMSGGQGDDLFIFTVTDDDPNLSQALVHEILDFVVGDRVRVAEYDISNQAERSAEQRFEELYEELDAGFEGNLPIRVRHERYDDMDHTIIEADLDRNDVYEISINLHGVVLPLVIETNIA